MKFSQNLLILSFWRNLLLFLQGGLAHLYFTLISKLHLAELSWSDPETIFTNIWWFKWRFCNVFLKRKFVIQIVNNAQMNLEVSLLDFMTDLKKLTKVSDNKRTEYNKDNVHHIFKRHLLNLCFQLIVAHSSCAYSVKRTLNLQT